MARIIAYDLCRLFIGPYYATPRGIDRVDLAVAKHVFADPAGPHIGILPTPFGVRAYPAWAARRLLGHLQSSWGEQASAPDDERLDALVAQMGSPGSAPAPGTPRINGLSRAERIGRCLAMLRHTGLRIGRAAERAVPADAVYVCLGQQVLAVPMFFAWLRRRPDVACALMIHDTIPLDHPEMVDRASVAHHARMIRTAAIHGDGLIFNTASARASVTAAMAAVQHRPRAELVRSLPVAAAFAEVRGGLPALAGHRYFVVVSTIEPRKNVGLLLRVWERLVARLGQQAPHLVIVGAPGRDARAILAPLAASPRLRGRVHQVSGLASPVLARLVSGCTALLSPSLAEGFGLPLLEGMAMGVPTLASDIPSHREIGRDATVLLDPAADAAWEAAILAMPDATPDRRRPMPVELTEAAYAADVVAFLERVPSKLGRGL